jgi:Tol biopolymer transport system component
VSERTQQILWAVLAIIALGLSAATAYLYVEARRVSSTAGAAYRLAYTSIEEESQEKLLGHIQSCNLHGKNVAKLTDSDSLDAFAACEPLSPGATREPRIAFLRLQVEIQSHNQPSPSDAGAPGGVYVVNATGGQAKRICRGLERMWSVAPSWSPDGKQLALAAVEDLNNDGQFVMDEIGIYVCDIESTESKRIASIAGAVTRLSWSPASPQIIVTFIQSGRVQSALLDAETGRSLLEGPAPAACWSPDGQELAAYLTDDKKIHILRPDGSESYELAPPGHVVQLLWLRTWPASEQSKQGRLLAISRPEHTSEIGQLYVRSAEPGDERWHPIALEGHVMQMSASPDGRYVAYTLLTDELAEAYQTVPPADLYLLELGQSQPVRLTSDPGFEGLATWIPVQ